LIDERRVDPNYRNRRVHVTARESPAEAVYVIRDEGPGFDPSKLPDPTDPSNLVRVSGRGLLLIRTFMDEVHHNEIGNEITMTKRRDR
jgi:anti-sigma regulatory factor (Ser/Thr protein kinase)